MTVVKGRESTTLQLRTERKRQLEAIKDHHRSTSNPNCSMTLVLEQLIEKEHKRLKL